MRSTRAVRVPRRLGHVVPRLLPLLLLASCAHKVVSFSVEPLAVCSGQSVDIRWNVQGRASLRIDRGGGDAAEEAVPSQGERKLTVSKPTTITVRALDANPADAHAQGIQFVDVPQGAVEKGASASCDSSSGKCTGSFDMQITGPGLTVRSLATPMIVRLGHAQPGRICVSHAGLAPTCLSANDKAEVAVAAAGVWTLETELPAGESTTPGPQLRVQLGFGCP
jgi:hypothetical protein